MEMEEASAPISGCAWLPSDLLDSILEKLIPVSDCIWFSAVCNYWRSTSDFMYWRLASAPIPDWASLPGDVLDLILEKLISNSDFIRFGAVCKRWQSVALDQKPQRLKSCHKQLPMLVVSDIQHLGGRSALYGVTQDKDYSFELQHELDYDNERGYFCGCSHGWLAYMNDDYLLTLFNPFTGRTIRLPRPFIKAAESKQQLQDFVTCIEKVVLSADPCLFSNGFEALILFRNRDDEIHIAHFKAGDNTWSHINPRTRSDRTIRRTELSDAIYHKGQFLAVTVLGVLVSINVNSVHAAITPTGATSALNFNNYYLVESSRGDLLLVEGFFNAFFDTVCKVWCAFRDDGGPRVEVGSIGTDALFLSSHGSMSVCALDFPECCPNSIYVTDRLGKRVVIFNVENGKQDNCWSYLDPGYMKGRYAWILPTVV